MAATGSTQCLTISITDDNIVESIESFSVAMLAASDSVTLGYPRTASVDITDNDGNCVNCITYQLVFILQMLQC